MDPSSLRWCTDWGAQSDGGTLHSSEGTSAAEISLWIINHHTRMKGQSILDFHPSYQFLSGLLYIFNLTSSVQLVLRWLYRVIVL